MPNKRKTRQLATQHRPKPTLPDGDEDKEMELEDRQKKLNVTIADFDNEVHARIVNLKSFAKELETKIRTACSMELLKIPKNVREMKVSDFLKNGGQVNADAAQDLEQVLSGSIAAKLESAKYRRAPLQTVNEEEEFGKPRKPPTGKRGRDAENIQSTAVPASRTMRKTRQRGLETPVNYNQSNKYTWGPTPLVTPKFDPRLPITPAVGRNPKPGENLMSVSGSPIYLDRRGGQVTERNKTLVLCQGRELDLDSVDGRDLDEAMTGTLIKMQEKIAELIQHKGKH